VWSCRLLPKFLPLLFLKMETICSSETLASTYNATCYYSPEYSVEKKKTKKNNVLMRFSYINTVEKDLCIAYRIEMGFRLRLRLS
jgi:hypothetical protein